MGKWMAAAACMTILAPAHAAEPAAGPAFISPMGEPFRGTVAGVPAMARWFRGADLDGDGRLTITEMRRDAMRFFATLDTDHDGEIDPEELATYENVIAPEIAALLSVSGNRELAEMSTEVDATAKDADGYPNLRQTENGGRRGRHRRDSDLPQTVLAITEPVATADRNLDRGVSRVEFDTAAQARFHLLDHDNAGYLTVEGLQKLLR